MEQTLIEAMDEMKSNDPEGARRHMGFKLNSIVLYFSVMIIRFHIYLQSAQMRVSYRIHKSLAKPNS